MEELITDPTPEKRTQEQADEDLRYFIENNPYECVDEKA